MVGQIFGKLVVKKELINYKGSNRKYYECECECKNIHIVRKDRLIRSRSIQCVECSRSKPAIIIGAAHGKWTILAEAGRNEKKEILVKVRCECGLEKIGVFRAIQSGKSKQCIPCASKRPIAGVVIGDTYFKRTVTAILGRSRKGNVYVKARCECGKEDSVMLYYLKNGSSAQCIDCTNNQKSRSQKGKALRHLVKHGLSYHPLYKLWSNIKDRCYSIKDRNYIHYGARGIELYDPWKHDVKKFIEDILAEIGPKTPEMCLDRIDANDNYRPGNIRWVTPAENASNRRISLKNRNENVTVPVKPLQYLIALCMKHTPTNELADAIHMGGLKNLLLQSKVEDSILESLGVRRSSRKN